MKFENLDQTENLVSEILDFLFNKREENLKNLGYHLRIKNE